MPIALVILKSLMSWFRCVWLGLELNSAERRLRHNTSRFPTYSPYVDKYLLTITVPFIFFLNKIVGNLSIFFFSASFSVHVLICASHFEKHWSRYASLFPFISPKKFNKIKNKRNGTQICTVCGKRQKCTCDIRVYKKYKIKWTAKNCFATLKAELCCV